MFEKLVFRVVDAARAVGLDGDGDADGLGRKEGLDELGPFHQADAVGAVEVVLVAVTFLSNQ